MLEDTNFSTMHHCVTLNFSSSTVSDLCNKLARDAQVCKTRYVVHLLRLYQQKGN